MQKEREAYHELTYYTLAHSDPSFIHQHVVDAFTAQQADGNTKPIAITFALVGLYLYVEKNYTGKEVQTVHMKLAAQKKVWPDFEPPAYRGEITVRNVMKASGGKERDDMIRKWCASVWKAYSRNQKKIESFLRTELYA